MAICSGFRLNEKTQNVGRDKALGRSRHDLPETLRLFRPTFLFVLKASASFKEGIS